MALPTLITVRGTILKPDGTPDSGTVEFHNPVLVRHSASDDVMSPDVLAITLQPNGNVDLQVPSTDDPAWSPVGWTYKVKLRLSGGITTFDAAIPYDTPGGILNLSDLLPVVHDTGVLYAAYGHTHTGFATDAELAAALQDAATDAELAAALTGYLTAAAAALTYLTKINPEIVNTTFVVRKADNSAALRYRSTGGAVDVDKSSGDVVESSFDGATPFTGNQFGLRRWRGDGNTFAGLTEFGNSVYGAQQTIDSRDPANAIAKLGGKAGAAAIHGGIKATPGAPTTGTWAKDSVVIDSAGVLHLCTAGGTPGTWT